MKVSFTLIYFGNCSDMIKFYMDIFEDATLECETYAEMPCAEVIGIHEPELHMIWKATLRIPFGKSAITFHLSDSLLTARRCAVSCQEQTYHPLICIEHSEEKLVRDLMQKIYGNEYSFQEIQRGACTDSYGIRWKFQKSNIPSIYYCLDFKGNCGEVIEYITNAYKKKAYDVILYGDSPWEKEIHSGAQF